MSHMQSLFHRLLGRQWVETQISIARRRDVHITAPDETWECICGDPSCDLPWSDGGKVIRKPRLAQGVLPLDEGGALGRLMRYGQEDAL